MARENQRDRVLTDLELAAFWKATAAAGQPFGPMLRIVLLTGQRRSEVGEMRDGEIFGDVWKIPAARSKNHRANAVPLSVAVKRELESVTRIGDEGWVFSTTGKTPVSGFSNAKEAVDRHMLAAIKERAGDQDKIELQRWTAHDLRRTLATGMARLGVAPHVIEAILNHKTGQISRIAGVYNVHEYEAEKRQALELWASHVLKLVGEAPTECNVIAIGGRARKNPRSGKSRE